MRASSFDAACRVAYKELLDGVRHRAGYVTMGMFALTVIAFMSMSLAGDMPDARQAATLYWIVLFFAATLQGERLFAEEAAAGTLLFLRIYVPAQAVLFGKMAAHLITLLVLSVLVMPLVIVLMDAMFMLDAAFLVVLILALWGMAAADHCLRQSRRLPAYAEDSSPCCCCRRCCRSSCQRLRSRRDRLRHRCSAGFYFMIWRLR